MWTDNTRNAKIKGGQIEVLKILNGIEYNDSNICLEIKESQITRGCCVSARSLLARKHNMVSEAGYESAPTVVVHVGVLSHQYLVSHSDTGTGSVVELILFLLLLFNFCFSCFSSTSVSLSSHRSAVEYPLDTRGSVVHPFSSEFIFVYASHSSNCLYQCSHNCLLARI